MKNRKICVFDIEGNSLTPDTIWVMSAAIFSGGEWRIKSTTDYDEMRKFFLTSDELIGHNIIRWDIPNIERLLDIKIKAKLTDTLAYSWYLEPYRMKHGLSDWGTELGVEKPVIQKGEWEGALEGETQEQFLNKMTHRCEEDVKINCLLIDKQRKNLINLYDGDEALIKRLDNYLMFKMHCARKQEESRWKLDVERCERVLGELELSKEEKVGQLILVMPKVQKFDEMWRPDNLYKKSKIYNKPKTYLKVNGSLSSAGKRYNDLCKSLNLDGNNEDFINVESTELNVQGIKWMDLIEANGLPETHEDPIEYLKSEKDANPNSTVQIKQWLNSFGWVPESFVFSRDADGNPKQTPQVRVDKKGEKVLCKSVKKLYSKEPQLEVLEGLSVLTHRISILKGFLKNSDDEGYVKAEIQGFTNTLRFKHRVVVNLPSIGKPYGEDVRGCLIADDGYELCGSDMSSLEDRTKQHYMWDYDPDYVKEMQTEGFDPHLDLAVVAGFLTQEQSDSHKVYGYHKNEYKNAIADGRTYDADNHKALYEVETDYSFDRAKAKTANYACVYGAGGATVARGAGITKSEGEALVKKYWDRNWAVEKVAQDQKVKRCLDSSWLFNPVSKMWYSLRTEKDRFSTLNQGTGVFCFDVWIKNFMKVREQLTGQMHDEVILSVKKGNREVVENMLNEAISLTNKQLKLNRDLGVDVQFGESYAEIH
jgi:hypothetical protein